MLNIEKLENVHSRDGKTIAACPACRAAGGDLAGGHLAIFADGRFGCVRYGGSSPESKEHRQIIAELAGDGTKREKPKTAPESFLRLPKTPEFRQSIILGRFGRSHETLMHVSESFPNGTKRLEQPSEPSENILDIAKRLFGPGAVWDDPDDLDFESWERLRLIEGILTLRDGKGRIAYTQSQIESCIIGIRGHVARHPKNAAMLARLKVAKVDALSHGELARRMYGGHRI